MERKWRVGFIICSIIAVIDILLVKFTSPEIGIPGVGVVTFLGLLMVTNLFSGDEKISKGEMRKAIAGASLVVYFTFLGGILSGKEIIESELVRVGVSHFTYIIGIIIAFYFGTRILEMWRSPKDGS